MKILALAMLLSIAPGDPSPVVALNTGTLQAWDAYIEAVRSHQQERLTGAKPFLWAEEGPRMTFVRGGGILVEPAEGNGRTKVEGGLIHHWIGAIFIPGANASQVLEKLDDYDDYRNFYAPTVIESRLLLRDGNTRRFSLRLKKKALMVTSIVDTDNETSTFQPEPDRWWSVSQSTRIQEVEHGGRRDEQLLPVGAGKGFLWRMYGLMRARNVEGGTVIEMEGIVLSRDIPAAVAWLVNPVVDRLSRSAMATTLSQTKDAVTR
jgi:hypothetical protein